MDILSSCSVCSVHIQRRTLVNWVCRLMLSRNTTKFFFFNLIHRFNWIQKDFPLSLYFFFPACFLLLFALPFFILQSAFHSASAFRVSACCTPRHSVPGWGAPWVHAQARLVLTALDLPRFRESGWKQRMSFCTSF